MKTREPETQETFDEAFKTDGMDAQQIAAKIDETIGELRTAAADFVRSLFLKHNYFNGNIEGQVDHENDWITVKIVVSCYGLPNHADAKGLEKCIRDGIRSVDATHFPWGVEVPATDWAAEATIFLEEK